MKTLCKRKFCLQYNKLVRLTLKTFICQILLADLYISLLTKIQVGRKKISTVKPTSLLHQNMNTIYKREIWLQRNKPVCSTLQKLFSIDYSTDFDLNLRIKNQKANISKVKCASFPHQNMKAMCKREIWLQHNKLVCLALIFLSTTLS
jgi:hypothetical protein